MRSRSIAKVLGVLLMFFSVSMLPPVAVSYIYGDSAPFPFFVGFFATLGAGLLLWLPTRNVQIELKTRDGFLIVVLFWTVLSVFASVPLVVGPHLSFVNSMFVSISGFTTTGAGAIPDLSVMPHAVLYYRQQLQFIGGMGIIVLAVAILPMIGVGGMQLYRAETPGPMKDDKLKPRIMQTAKIIWSIYVSFCALCALIYWVCGMPLFDAICESFSTVSTGGYSIHNDSFGFYHNPAILLTAVFFMVMGGINFSLHYLAIMKGKVTVYWRDVESRTFLIGFVVVAAIITGGLVIRHYYDHRPDAALKAVFNTASLMTTTGFTAAPYGSWPGFMPILLMIAGFVGACGGSTSGGLKVIRMLLLQKQVAREVKQLVHPHAVYPIKLGNKVLSPQIIQSVWAFFAVSCTIYILIIMLLMIDGMDFTSAFGTAIATFANVGVGLGPNAYNFFHLDTFSKVICMFAMLAGRLEVFTLLVIFSRGFWSK